GWPSGASADAIRRSVLAEGWSCVHALGQWRQPRVRSHDGRPEEPGGRRGVERADPGHRTVLQRRFSARHLLAHRHARSLDRVRRTPRLDLPCHRRHDRLQPRRAEEPPRHMSRESHGGAPRQGAGSALAVYLERPTLVMVALGFSASLPYFLVFDTLSAWFRDEG